MVMVASDLRVKEERGRDDPSKGGGRRLFLEGERNAG